MSSLNELYYRYKVDVKFHIKNKEGELVSTVIPFKYQNLTIVNDYFNHFLPILKLSCQIGTDDAQKFIKYEKYVTCAVVIEEEIGTNEDFTVVTRNRIMNELFLVYFDRSKFSRMFNDDIVNIKKTNPDKEMEEDIYIDESKMGILNQFKLNCILYPINALKAKKVMYNDVLAPDTSTDKEKTISVREAIVYIVNNNKYINECLIDSPDNMLGYNQIMLLPYNLPLSITSLQRRYGIFNNGIVSFYDFGRLYIMSKYSIDHAIPKDSKKFVELVLTENQPTVSQNTSVIGTTTGEKYIRNFNIRSAENQTVMTEIFGDKILFSNFETAITSTQFTEDKLEFKSPIRELDNANISHNESGIKVSSDYDDLNNVYNLNEYVRSSNTYPITVRVDNSKIGGFEPYRTVKVSVTNQQSEDRFGGLYQIAMVTHVLVFGNNEGDLNRTTPCNSSLVLASTGLKDGFTADDGIVIK